MRSPVSEHRSTDVRSALDGQVVLATGATRGIGLAVARAVAGAGACVLMNHRGDPQRAQPALEEVRSIHPGAALIRADIADPAALAAMFREIKTRFGRLDGLVQNAGITADGHALMMGDEKWQRVIDTNLTGAFACCRAAGRIMIRQRAGAIVAIGSTSGLSAPAGQVNYAASKAGLLAAVRVLAKELGPSNVRVNAVVPGFVETAMTHAMPSALLDSYVEHIPLRRVGQPDEVADLVRFLLSDQSRYITGASLVIDGGLTC
jgi:3-oxoacyl-[acyl-carrier protein] reductase